MAKVLLSFLGTGRMSDITEPNEKSRKYSVAKYQIGDKVYESSFIASAIVQNHDIEKIIMIGTPKSMWENVYYFFYTKNHGEKEADTDDSFISIYDEIENHIKTVTPDSPLYMPHKEQIEEAMGGNSKVVLIRYGINEQQIKENIAHILEIEKFLEPNDELIIDITHSFRSLPIYIMNLLIYLRNVSSKNIKIPHIYYGMLEGMDPVSKITPVVDLKSLLELQDWIIGAYSIKEYGNTYKIAELLRNQTPESNCDKGIANQLETFSDYVNLNYIDSMMKVIQSLSGIQGKCENEMAKLVVNPVIDDFLKKFKGKHFTDSVFLYRLSEWLFKNKKYAQSYLTTLEAIISYSIELNGYVLKEERENNEKGSNIKFFYTKDNEVWDSYALRKAIPIVFQKNLKKKNKRMSKEEYFQSNLANLKDSPKSIEEKITLLTNLFEVLDGNETLKEIYSTHNKHRNQVAHLITARSDGATYSSKEIIKALRETLVALKKLIK